MIKGRLHFTDEHPRYKAFSDEKFQSPKVGFGPPNIPFPWGIASLSNTVLLEATLVSLPNGISFPPTALSGCTSVTEDIQTNKITKICVILSLLCVESSLPSLCN